MDSIYYWTGAIFFWIVVSNIVFGLLLWALIAWLTRDFKNNQH